MLKVVTAKELNTATAKEFVLYQSVAQNGIGRVLFTFYYEPIYTASRLPTSEYRYAVYRLPPNLRSCARPHPTRLELEGADGLQGYRGRLKGLELF
ncbi:Membrane-bound lytic murein transglycosylase A precursor [Richelia intracellularis]|nr:Membrane-bound lytic murein transglycosylase A precursor [Richelia intracellularis]